MKRRAFLKLFVGTVAIATIPIPKFLLAKEEKAQPNVGSYGAWDGTVNMSGGTLTMEMIEDAALRAAQNMGEPDMMWMSKRDYKKLGRYFGYKVIYRGDDIVHVKL